VAGLRSHLRYYWAGHDPPLPGTILIALVAGAV
jgi:hypothetical protein